MCGPEGDEGDVQQVYVVRVLRDLCGKCGKGRGEVLSQTTYYVVTYLVTEVWMERFLLNELPRAGRRGDYKSH